MKRFKLSVHQYRRKLEERAEKDFGFADPVEIEEKVKRYAMARQEHKRRIQGGDFNPFTDDPNCKTCGKK